MNRLMITLAVTAALAAGDLPVLPAPAAAQAGKYTITVYGNDPCPRDDDDLHRASGEASGTGFPDQHAQRAPRQEKQFLGAEVEGADDRRRHRNR